MLLLLFVTSLPISFVDFLEETLFLLFGLLEYISWDRLGYGSSGKSVNLTLKAFYTRIMLLTVCSCHLTYEFQSEFILDSCLNVKELLARSSREIWRLSDCNWTRTQNHLVLKRTLNHLAKLAKWLSYVNSYVRWQVQMHRKCTVQISTQNTAQSFGQFGQMVECLFKN